MTQTQFFFFDEFSGEKTSRISAMKSENEIPLILVAVAVADLDFEF